MNNKLLVLEKRGSAPAYLTFAIALGSVVFALLFGALFLAFTGHNPIDVYRIMFGGAFGSAYGLSETLIKAIPLMLAGLGVSIAFKMLLWNIGAEGQLYMGAFAASYVALFHPELPIYIMLPAMFLAAAVAGGIWALVSAIPRAYLSVNETITSLLLNYVAILWVDYLVYGPWKDPKGFNFPLTAPFVEAAQLPTIGTTRIHFGIILGLVAAVLLYFVLNRSRWGYEIRVIGESQKAARYGGMNIKRNILLVMFLSGALAGIAGFSEVAGITHRLQHGLSPGYGYTAIIIAWLAKLHPAAVVLVSILFGGLLVGGYTIQTAGLPAATVSMLQGAVLFFLLGGELLNRYRIRWGFRKGGN
jgi:ABC-type uncharacterized transport system permease subunit